MTQCPRSNDEIIADDMLRDGFGVLRFQAHGIRAKIGLEIMLRKRVEADAHAVRIIIEGDLMVTFTRFVLFAFVPLVWLWFYGAVR